MSVVLGGFASVAIAAWSAPAFAADDRAHERVVDAAAPPEGALGNKKPRNDWLFRPFQFWGVIALNALSGSASGSETKVGAGAASQQTSAFGAASTFDLVGSSVREGLSVRSHGRFGAAVGGAETGFEGRSELLLTVGPSFGHTLVAFAPRLGLGGVLRGNRGFRRAALALPRADLAVELHPTERLFFELGATSAVSLVGRFNVGDAVQKTGGSFEAGAFAVAAVSSFSFVARADRTFGRGPRAAPVDTLDLHACLNPVSLVVFCPSASWSRGEAIVRSLDEQPATVTRAATFQLTLGFGAIETL
jgi:hypothetical protein